jgi:hypothetical protein
MNDWHFNFWTGRRQLLFEKERFNLKWRGQLHTENFIFILKLFFNEAIYILIG